LCTNYESGKISKQEITTDVQKTKKNKYIKSVKQEINVVAQI